MSALNSRAIYGMVPNRKSIMDDDQTNISSDQLHQVDKDLASQNEDTRWQAAIALGAFSESDPEAIWPLTVKYGSSRDEDTREAVATCVLEHIFEYHFDAFFEQVKQLILQGNAAFADIFTGCWQFGAAKLPGNSEQFKSLHKQAARLWQSRQRKRKTRSVMVKERRRHQRWRERNRRLSFGRVAT